MPSKQNALLDRREFLVSTAIIGGGLALGIGNGAAQAAAATGVELSPWIEIGPDDSVTIRAPEPEIGNGAMAQIAMTVAEELNCAWHHARVVNASVQRNHLEGGVYAVGFQPFFGGHSTQPPRFAHGLQLGASARERLKAAAAARWAVPVGEVEASESVLTHKPSGLTLRYGDVAAAAASVKLPEEPKPKPRAQWRLIGKASPAKLSIPDVTRGKAIYGIDVRLPGMVYAALMQAAVQGGRLKSYKPEAVLKMPGVRAVIVIDPAATKGSPVPQKSTFGFDDTKAQSGGAVIADHYWQARTALEALPLEWEAGPGGQWADDGQIYDAARALLGQPGNRTLKTLGDVATATGKRMAVAVARQFPRKPLELIWTREECFRQGRYRTPIVSRFRRVLDDATGLPQAVNGDCVYVGSRPPFQLPLGFSDQPYFNSGIIPNVKLTGGSLPVSLLNGAWRGPCYNSHAFNVETFIDECAVAAGFDPLAYRLSLLANWDASWSDCLRVAADKAGWGKCLPKGEGLGIAISCWPVASARRNGSVVATVARVAVSAASEVKVRQIDVAFDCGSVANPDAVRAQVEGGTVYGLNSVLNERLGMKDGAIVEGNFDEYPIIRIADMPILNVHFDALSGHERMAIIGEAPTGPIQPAVGNAIFAATGKRVRQTPVRMIDLGQSPPAAS